VNPPAPHPSSSARALRDGKHLKDRGEPRNTVKVETEPPAAMP
jgi:hypothetical protein